MEVKLNKLIDSLIHTTKLGQCKWERDSCGDYNLTLKHVVISLEYISRQGLVNTTTPPLKNIISLVLRDRLNIDIKYASIKKEEDDKNNLTKLYTLVSADYNNFIEDVIQETLNEIGFIES